MAITAFCFGLVVAPMCRTGPHSATLSFKLLQLSHKIVGTQMFEEFRPTDLRHMGRASPPCREKV